MKTKDVYRTLQTKSSWVVVCFGLLANFPVKATGDTLFVDEFHGASSKNKAKYHIVREDVKKHKKQLSWTETVYYASGQLHSTYPVTCTKAGYPEKNGLYKEFYPNGNVKKGV